MDDEDYAEIIEQLELFKANPNLKELPLPAGFDPSVIRMIDDIVSRMGLDLAPGRITNQYKVIKKA